MKNPAQGRAYVTVADRIRNQGPINFDLFMDIALYSEKGYYMNEDIFGMTGDYYTSPTLHPMFGAMLALQLCQMWECLGRPDPFTVLEIGSGNGVLARDIMTSLRASDSKCIDCLEYVTVDRIYPTIRVEGVIPLRPEHLSNLHKTGVVLSNELLDAMPTRMIEIRSGRIHELMITLDSEGNLVEVLSENPVEELESLNVIADLASLEGYRGPLSTRLNDWCRTVSSALQMGFVVTVDYGMEREEYYSMDRSHRLIQTYYRHIDNLSYLHHVGDQDITAHVNFSYFRELALLNNLNSLHSTNQRDWLYDLHFKAVLNVETHGGFTSRREVALVNRLVEKEGLGGFKVEIFQKGLIGICYKDLIPNVEFAKDNFSIPPISTQHMAAGLSFK